MDEPGENKLSIACFGRPGSYTDEAMGLYFEGRDFTATYFPHFEDVIQAVASRKIRYGVLPIENSSTGGITDVYDFIHRYDCCIVGEKYVKIDHCLLGLPGAEIDNIRDVYSHIQGLNQCRDYLKHYPKWQLHPYFSTSESAEKVRDMKNPHIGAIANKTAAELYKLDVLAESINDNTQNYTRFLSLRLTGKKSRTRIKSRWS